MFIQQILNQSQPAPLLAKPQLRSPSGHAATTPSNLISSLTTLQHFRWTQLRHQTGPNQHKATFPLQARALLLPSTFKFLQLHRWKTWRRQKPQMPLLLQAAKKVPKRKCFLCRRRWTLRLSCQCSQKLRRRRRNLQRKTPQKAMSQSRSQVQLRRVREERTQSWLVLNDFLQSNHSGFQFVSWFDVWMSFRVQKSSWTDSWTGVSSSWSWEWGPRRLHRNRVWCSPQTSVYTRH